MASPRADVPGQEQSKGKKKGKQKKAAASSDDGGPGQSTPVTGATSSHVSSPPFAGAMSSLSDVKSSPPSKLDMTSKSKTPGSPADKDATSQKDKQQKKQEKQSKPPQSKSEGNAAPSAGSGGAGAGAGGEGEGEKPKSKAQLKAERRAIQERQRALKEAKKAEAEASGGAAGGGGGTAAAAASAKKEASGKKEKGGGGGDPSKGAGASGEGAKGRGSTAKTMKSSKGADHNLSGEAHWVQKEKELLTRGCKIDDGIFNLGLQYFHHKIVGANARCVALLTTLKEVIGKYKTPEEKELTRDLEKNFLAPCIKYINDCRPLSTSMGNGIKYLKQQINQIPQGTDDQEAISILHEAIDNFIFNNITKATEAVAVYANNKIDNGDVILIYAASSLIAQVLKHAHDKGKQFRVIVVEGRPRTEGLTMLKYLVRCGISCSYIYIGSASHAMRETTKVFLGAAAMFAIGDMHSRTGNAMIAALAKANNIPVLVCCETYKFTDKVQLPGISNQQARGKDLISIGHRPPTVPNYEEIDLHLLNIMYDVTHSRYITALVTELGMLPCTSVPVVLRRQEDKCL